MGELWKNGSWISMPFGMVSGVCRGKGVLDEVHIPQGEGWFGFFRLIGLSGVFECIFKTEMLSTRV